MTTLKARGVSSKQTGVALIEAMVAILIFSVGILAIVALQALSMRNTTDAQFRAEAALLANSAIAEMRLANQVTVATDFATGGAAYNAWKARVEDAATGLPKDATTPAPTITFVGRQVTITLFWRAQSDSATRQHVVLTQLD
jgi:type IV pilus assembly protein PilV